MQFERFVLVHQSHALCATKSTLKRCQFQLGLGPCRRGRSADSASAVPPQPASQPARQPGSQAARHSDASATSTATLFFTVLPHFPNHSLRRLCLVLPSGPALRHLTGSGRRHFAKMTEISLSNSLDSGSRITCSIRFTGIDARDALLGEANACNCRLAR